MRVFFKLYSCCCIGDVVFFVRNTLCLLVSELDEFLGDLEEDVEGMQTMIYVLQQQLREAKESITALEEENSRLRAGDTSVPTKTLPKKPDKIEDVEMTNQNTYSDTGKENSKPMETKYYEEKTESELEAEYNYEGMYENDEKYQEEGDRQHDTGNYEYEENGYQNYTDDYTAQDYKSEDEIGHEAMETDDTHSQENSAKKTHNVAKNGTADGHTSPAPNSVLTEVSKSDSPSDQTNKTSQQCSSSNTDSRQHAPSDSSTAGSNRLSSPGRISPSLDTTSSPEAATTCRNSEHQTSLDHSNRQSPTDSNPRSPENTTRIPSPQTTKISPVKLEATKQKTTEESSPKNNTDMATNGSPSNSSSPCRTSSSPNQVTANEEKTSDGSKLNQTVNEKSPGSESGPQKDREPVLQKFLNGVTSTVDDIEDL